MPLTMRQAASRGSQLLDKINEERSLYDPVRLYWKGRQQLPAVIPKSAPAEVREMARISRVNVCEIVVQSLVQSLIVEGIRSSRPENPDDPNSPAVDALVDPVWAVWQANRLDKRQSGITAAAIGYGKAYGVVAAGVLRGQDSSEREFPAVRGVSPRRMVALYEDGPDWPTEALERVGGGRYVLYDAEALYPLRLNNDTLQAAAEEPTAHPFRVAPVVKYEAEDDLDDEDEPPAHNPVGHGHRLPVEITTGQIAQLVEIQDQVDAITFNLMVAQHYSAFRQRYILGWVDATEKNAMETAASQTWVFKDHPDDMELGEFSETRLDGYINSREHALKYGATLTQTPVHELTGQLINMAADALAAAEAGRDRKVELMKTSLGESHEQLGDLIAIAVGAEFPDDAQIVWRDTSARAFSAVVQGLGMLATQLGMPPQELWHRVPGFTQQDIRRMKEVAAQGDSLANLTAMLDQQAGNGGSPTSNGERQSESGLILPPGVAA